VVWASPWCGFTSLAHISWGSVEPNAMGLPSEDRALNPMFSAPTISLSNTQPLRVMIKATRFPIRASTRAWTRERPRIWESQARKKVDVVTAVESMIAVYVKEPIVLWDMGVGWRSG